MAEQQQLQPGQTEEPAETGFFDRLFSGDKPLWIIVISLAIISLLVVYSSTASMAYKNAGGNTAHYFFNQLKFIAIGFVIMWFVHRINYQRYVRFTVVLFILALGFMLLTFVIGVNLNSASRWIRIPIIGMTFQPAARAATRQTPEGDRQDPDPARTDSRRLAQEPAQEP